MKNCPSCGAEMEDSARFCRSCGIALDPAASKVSMAEPVAEEHAPDLSKPETPKAPAGGEAQPNGSRMEDALAEGAQGQPEPSQAKAAASDAAKTAGAGAAKAFDFVKEHKKPFVIGAAIVVAAIIVIVAMNVLSKPIGSDRLKSDLYQTSFVTNGAVSSNYVNESTYEITDLSISDEQTSKQTILGSSYDMVTVTYSGTMSNDNFETQFTGTGYYYKTGDSYQCMSCDSSATETKPLKGVDYMTGSTVSDEITVSDFISDFTESNGTYTSVASQECTYDFWFATDACTNTQTFTFSPTSGWKATGDADVEEQRTEWKLAGKSFALANESTSSSWSRSSTMTFKDCSADGVTADYSFSASYNSTNQYNADSYKDVKLSGGLVGAVTHDFGTETFKIELNDSENSVTFQLSSNNSTVQAGTGTVNSMRATLDTQAVYYENDIWGSKVYENVSLVYAEQATA